MRRPIAGAAVAVLLLVASCGGSKATTVYARGLTHVSAFAFDGQGRLWAATAEFTDAGNDAVYVVAKAGDSPAKVVSGLHTPLGLLWIGGSLLVASKERVDAYSGFSGQAFTSTKELVAFPSGVGELNGFVRAPDGRVQLGISAPCDHCQPALPMSGAIVSFRPDGSDLRTDVFGIRAPINLAYRPGSTPGISELLVTMNQRDDLGNATPGDWLANVLPGQKWGFPDCYGQGGAVCADVPSPIAVLDKHAAVSGLVVTSTAAYVAEWATGKVIRYDFKRGTTSIFFGGAKNPEPLARSSDGSLLVGDWATGTVYRLPLRG